MPQEIIIPKIGLTMAEGKLVQWCKSEGATVTVGEVLFVVETEKATFEVEANQDGVLGKILVQEGESVPVGTVVAHMASTARSAAPPAQASQRTAANASGTHAVAGQRVRATPLARKLARELAVDLSSVCGTGVSGRIVADDVKEARGHGPRLSLVKDGGKGPMRSVQVVPLSPMRKAIARSAMAAKLQTAQTYMSLSADATAVVGHRRSLLPHVEKRYGVSLGITDMLMKIAGHAVSEHPVINTQWTEEGIRYWPDVHMGMAMAVDDGLIVPVLRDLNAKSLGQIAVQRTALVRRGRDNKLRPDEIEGSTFTLSALGMFGVESFTANINANEAAILAVGAIIEKPAVTNGQVVVRPTINVSLTYDHRIIDGVAAAKFMRTLKSLIEDPIRLLA